MHLTKIGYSNLRYLKSPATRLEYVVSYDTHILINVYSYFFFLSPLWYFTHHKLFNLKAIKVRLSMLSKLVERTEKTRLVSTKEIFGC